MPASIYTLNININSSGNPNKPTKLTLNDGTQVTDYTDKQRKEKEARGYTLKSIRSSAVKSYWDKKNDASYKQLQDADQLYKDFLDKGGDPKSQEGARLSSNIRNAKNDYDKAVKSNTQAAANVNAAIGYAVEALKETGQFMMALPGSKYSDTAAQNNINNVMGAAGKAGSMVSSIAYGAAAGGWVGAVIAAVGEVALFGVNAYTNSQEFQWTQQKHTVDEVRANERLGTVRTNRNR